MITRLNFSKCSVTLVKSNAKALSAEPKVQCALRGGLRYLRIPLIRGICDAPVIYRSVIFFVVVTTVTLVTVIGIYIMLPVTAVTTVTVGAKIDG